MNRVLARLEVKQLEVAHLALVDRLIRHKKFHRYVIEKRYPIAVDGTEKLARDGQWWDAEWLQRQHQDEDGNWIQQYVYVLEANFNRLRQAKSAIESAYTVFKQAGYSQYDANLEQVLHSMNQLIKDYQQ